MIWREVLAQLRTKYEEMGVQHRQGAPRCGSKVGWKNATVEVSGSCTSCGGMCFKDFIIKLH